MDKTTLPKFLAKACLAAAVWTALASAGCAFHAPSDDNAAAECKEDSDCAQFRSCNPIARTCDLQAPPPKDFVLAGPFDCATHRSTKAGTSFAGQWPAFEDGGYSIAADSTRLSDSCYITDDSDGVAIWATGGRQESHSFQMLGFYQLLLSMETSQATLGTHTFTPKVSWLLFCPTFPKDRDGSALSYDPYYNQDVDGCLGLLELTEVTVNIVARSSTRITGYVTAKLNPFVSYFEFPDGGAP